MHKALFRATGGRIGTNQPGANRPGTLFLLARGRTTGQERRTGLYFVEDGPSFVVVASNAGEDDDPGWWRNLQANPEAQVELGGRRRPVRARAATPEEEARLWPRLDAVYGEYANYRRKTVRHIPIVLLEPRETVATRPT